MSRFLLPFFIILTVSPLGAAGLTKPGRSVALRAPAVPLVMSDPYLSVWSPYDTLTEGDTEHWSGAVHPLIGALRVDGKVYRFMGANRDNLHPVIPMSSAGAWEATYTFDRPSGQWMSPNYNDSSWRQGKAAFGTREMPGVATRWDTRDIWVRRTFDLDDDFAGEELVLKYSHDDIFELYLNGYKLVETDYSWNNDVALELSDAARKKLRKGRNVIAAHCHNRSGGAYLDFGIYTRRPAGSLATQAVQRSVDVLPTQTYYTFECGPVELDLVFTAPMLPHDLDLISTPINYISYGVRSLDGNPHEVQLYIGTTPEIAVNDISQPICSERIEKGGLVYLKTGTIDQPYTKRVGDGVRIDWGYAYLAAGRGENKALELGEYFAMKESFSQSGKLVTGCDPAFLSQRMTDGMTVLAFAEDLGTVRGEDKSGYLMIGYDDVWSIEYFYERLKAYWMHDGKVDIFRAFERARDGYESLMRQCRDFDMRLMGDAEEAGGSEYAELCALVYRQVMAAHKLLTDKQGNLMFMSKENYSNGCINTVDLTYPSSPMFLVYNTDLLKGMMTPIFHYSESGRWAKPYPAHDLGTYPVANGQLYGEDMPVEEAGNMILLAMAVSKVDGNASYALRHWKTLTTWTDYLVEVGLDPRNQLCTDDFAGHLAHNVNLSVKAIMAIAAYGYMAEMAGMEQIASDYIGKSRAMAHLWESMAREGDHYRLAFDAAGTWSQKYNMVWDNVFSMGIFPQEVKEREVAFYLTKQAEHTYGLPLDSRKNYTKSDWVIWSACLNSDDEIFRQIFSPMYKYANETPSRSPISDWHDTDDAKRQNFTARSVVGGYYMKLLDYKINGKR